MDLQDGFCKGRTENVFEGKLRILHTLLTTLNNVGSVRRQQHVSMWQPQEKGKFMVTYGVLIVKPRIAGTRERKARAEAANFMVVFLREFERRVWSLWSRTKWDELVAHSKLTST